MYLRKNKVRCGESRRTYLSIAHNVWWAGDGTKKAQSRPIVIASFGVEDNVDLEMAREIVHVVEQCMVGIQARRGEGKTATLRVAQDVRRIEPFLKALASKRLGLAELVPAGIERTTVIETLIRSKLAEPGALGREDELVASIRAQLGA
jgi:hypothetical protein